MVLLWTVTSFSVFFLFRLVLFRYVGVIAHVFCPADVLVCLFVVNVANFWYVVIENRLSNSKLHCSFLVPYFGFYFSSLGVSSKSFPSHFVAVIVLSAHSYLVFVCVGWYFDLFFVRRNGTTDFAKTGQVSDDTINLINC